MISLLALAIALSGPDSDTPSPADRLAHDQMLVLEFCQGQWEKKRRGRQR